MTNNEKFIAEMQKKKVPACISEFTEHGMIVELGFGYPDRILDKVYDIADKHEVKLNSVCADFSGGIPTNVTRTGGGPGRY